MINTFRKGMKEFQWLETELAIKSVSSLQELLECLEDTNKQFFSLASETSNLTDSEKLSLCHTTGSQSELQFSYPASNKQVFLNKFSSYLNLLLNDVAINWVSQISSDDKKRLYYSVFVYGPVMDCFMSILSNLKNGRHIKILQACYDVLKHFVNVGRIQQLIVEQSLMKSNVHSESIASKLINIPESIDNKIILISPNNCFEKSKYTVTLIQNLLGSLEKLRQDNSTRFEFIGKLLGKLCFLSDNKVVIQCLLEYVQRSIDNGRQISEVITHVSPQYLESVVLPFFTCNYISYDELKRYIDTIFGSKIVLIGKLSTLLYHRLIFIKYFRDIRPKFLLFYPITTVPERRYLLTKTLLELLTLWGNRSSADQQPYEQHFALCEAIIVCFFYMDNDERIEIQDKILSLLVTGVPVHLESNHIDFRYSGMVTAEILTQFLGISADKPLKFDYHDTEDTRRLKSLTEGYKEHIAPEEPPAPIVVEVEGKIDIGEGTLDSDDDEDDLKPMSNEDVDLAKPKPPKYLRECIEILSDRERDFEKIELTLRTLPSVLKQATGDCSELALEITQLVLHMGSEFYMEDFAECRKKVLVGCAVKAPPTVADYLCYQFYEDVYTISHRLDILDVIVRSAKELSKLEEDNDVEEPLPSLRKLKMKPWEIEVMERVQKKTRRFNSATKVPVGRENKFNSVCGHFFYSLLNQFDKDMCTLNLTEEDTLVLGRLIYTLGVVLYCAKNSTKAPGMSNMLLYFIRVFTDVFVVDEYIKRTILFSTSIVAQVSPVVSITADIYPQLMHIRLWAEELLADSSISSETTKLAMYALEVMDTVAGQALFPSDLSSLSEEYTAMSLREDNPNRIRIEEV